MEQAAITDRVQARFGDAILAQGEFQGQYFVSIAPETLLELADFLKSDSELSLDRLMDVTAVDMIEHPMELEHRFEVVYQFMSYDLNHRFRVKVQVPDENLEVPSLWDRWGVANWMEREVFDLFGITFSGHPNLKRIMCHHDFVGHALRKDYPIRKRQQLSRPIEMILTEKQEWA